MDYRVEFTKWWTTEFKTVKFPTTGTVFDYYIDTDTKKFEPWTKMVQKFELDPDLPLQVSGFNQSSWSFKNSDESFTDSECHFINRYNVMSIIVYLLQAALVHTSETTRVKYFLDMLVDKRRPVMLVGTAGTGKTVLMGDKLNALSEDFMVTNIPFNFYTTSEMLQRTLEKPLEKKAGRNFGPPGTRRLIYFVDDMNMPEVLLNISSISC